DEGGAHHRRHQQGSRGAHVRDRRLRHRRGSLRDRSRHDCRTEQVVAERETLEVDVLIVGGGPPGMSAALRLAQLQKEKGGEPLAIAVLEKARETGAHMLSGALLDPSTLKDLVPDFKEKGAPLAADVRHDDVYFLTRTGKVRFPITPPPLRNHGNYIISL